MKVENFNYTKFKIGVHIVAFDNSSLWWFKAFTSKINIFKHRTAIS